jgi:hypothetical protein
VDQGSVTDTQNQREIPVSQPEIGLPLQCLPLESAGALFERADKALYTANGCGRDCTIVDEGVARVAQVVLATWQARPASFAGRCSITRAICSCCCLIAGERDDFSINDCIDVAFTCRSSRCAAGLPATSRSDRPSEYDGGARLSRERPTSGGVRSLRYRNA